VDVHTLGQMLGVIACWAPECSALLRLLDTLCVYLRLALPVLLIMMRTAAGTTTIWEGAFCLGIQMIFTLAEPR
jgi:hypothetical protein